MMKKPYLISGNSFFLLLALFCLPSCGLKYAPPESSETVEADRRMALEQQLSQDYKSLGKKYIPLTYGDLEVVKPNSYKRLDSLFAVKYRQGGNAVKSDIDNQIDYQQAIIQNDTNPVLYVETHWYELIQDSSYEFITSEISLKKNNSIYSVKNLDYFSTFRRYSKEAESYMRETSILTPGMSANTQELSFYTAYKTHAATLSGPAKDAFLTHTFELMRIIDESNMIYTESLLKILATNEIRKAYASTEVPALTIKPEEVSDNSSGKAVFQFYRVTVNIAGKEEPVVYLFDQFLQLID